MKVKKLANGLELRHSDDDGFTLVFNNPDGKGEPDCAIPTLYIKRAALPKNPPVEITVTVECDEKE